MKGSLKASPSFTGLGIRQPTVIMIRPLVAYDEQRLYFKQRSVRWQSKDIVNCTYSQNYKVLLILTDDYKVHVYTEALELITHLHNWEPKFIVGFKLLEEQGLLLLIGTEEIELMRISILTNIKRTKFLSSMKFSIRRDAHIEVSKQSQLKWNKGYGYQVSEDLLYVWSLNDIHFYSLRTLALRTRIANLAKKENSLTTAFFSCRYKYTVTGLLSGEVKVWRLPINPLYLHKEILIHTWSHHTREVEEVIQGRDERTLLTYAQDLSVAFLSLETFQLLRTFNFAGEYSKIYLFDHLSAYALKDGCLGLLAYGHHLEFLADLTAPPIAHHHAGSASSLTLQLTLASNLGLEVSASELSTADQLNTIELKHLYPPLKSKSIQQILASPYEPGCYFMIVEDGDIFRARLQGSAGRIDRHYNLARSLDSEKHPLHQHPTQCAFLSLLPPAIDTQIMERAHDSSYPSSISERTVLGGQLRLLAVGCSRGSVIFVSSEDMQTVYARISYHREKVIGFQEVRSHNEEWLVSICEERLLKLTVFKGGRAHCLLTVSCGQQYRSMLGCGDCLTLVLQKGVFEVARFDEDRDEPVIQLNREAINHEDEIVSIDYRADLGLLMTAGKDNRIKVWTLTKVLLYEVCIDHTLDYALWAGDMNILLVHDRALYALRPLPLIIDTEQLTSINDSFYEHFDIDDEYSLTVYFSQALSHPKLSKTRGRMHSLQNSPQQAEEPLSAKRNRKLLSPLRNEKKINNNSSVFEKTPPSKHNRRAIKTESSDEKGRQDSDLLAVKKHLQELSQIKKATNESVLPKIKPKSEDIFVEFMREKLLNKKLLTRRDITLNRIIMKNLIKDHLGSDNEAAKNFKLD